MTYVTDGVSFPTNYDNNVNNTNIHNLLNGTESRYRFDHKDIGSFTTVRCYCLREVLESPNNISHKRVVVVEMRY